MQFRLIALIGIMAFLVSFVVFAQPGNAQAALTLNNFVGFETGGTDEALASAGSPVLITSPTPHSGDWALEMNASIDRYEIPTITGGSSDGDNDFIVGFWIQFPDKTPSGNTVFLNSDDDSGAVVWRLILQADSDLVLEDANNGAIGSTISDPFTVNQYHLIEIRWQHSASGAIDLHIDGVSKISETGQDLTDGGAIGADLATYRLLGMNGAVYHLDDFYAYSGATGTGDFLGDAEVFRYQANTNSATPDDGCAGTGGALDTGVWQDLGETPLSVDATEPTYTAVGQGSMWADDTQSGNHYRHGPHDDANIDGDSNIKGAKYLHVLKRDNGAGTTHFSCLGNDSENTSTNVVSLDVSFLNFITVSVASAIVPTSSEHCAIGMGRGSGGRNIAGQDFWCLVLHVPDAGGAPRRIFPVQ